MYKRVCTALDQTLNDIKVKLNEWKNTTELVIVMSMNIKDCGVVKRYHLGPN